MSSKPHRFCLNDTCNDCYKKSFASHERSKYWSNKNEKSPREATLYSNKKFYFECEDCNHELYLPLTRITIGSWCKYCNQNRLCDSNDCQICFNKSMASHPMGKCWSSKNVLTPRNVGKGSETKYWFKCADCNHEFQTGPALIKKDKLCPYCSNQTLCDADDCDTCFKKSCASTNIVKKWHSSNEKTPRQVAIMSNKKVTLYCDKCKHTMMMPPNKYNLRNDPCTYCTGDALCDKEDCAFCFKASFASHPHAKEWSSKNTVTPRSVRRGAEKRFLFNCETCSGEFSTLLYNVLTGFWCPHCKNKSEALLYKFLQEKFGDDVIRQARFPWCVNDATGVKLPFDFLIKSKKILIELDGMQHFIQVSNWKSPEENKKRDSFKQESALANSYRMIRIFQDDFWNDRFDWQAQLLEAIEKEDSHIQYLEAVAGKNYLQC